MTEFKIGQKVKASGKCEHGDDDFERYCAINWLEQAHELDDHFTVKNILEDENGRKLLHLDVGWEFFPECMELVDEPDWWTSEDAREYLTPQQAADLLKMSRPHLMKLVRAGELDAEMVGTHHRIPMTEILGFIDRRERAKAEVAAAYGGAGSVEKAARDAAGQLTDEEYLTLLHGMNFATSETGGTKQVKPARIDLIPADALRELAEHYGKGVEKYPSDEDGLDNWRNGMPYSLSLAALYRHLNLYTDGVDIDEENGSKHLIAVAWHALNLAHWHNDEEMTAKYDDRQAVIEKRRKEA